MEQTSRVEGKATVPSGWRDFTQSGSASDSYIRNGLLQITGGALSRNCGINPEILLGTKG